jgi:hypothetical protein
MKNYLQIFLHLISTAVGRLHNSQNSKEKYESRKILDFVRKNDFFFIFFVVSSTFLVILKIFN